MTEKQIIENLDKTLLKIVILLEEVPKQVFTGVPLKIHMKTPVAEPYFSKVIGR